MGRQVVPISQLARRIPEAGRIRIGKKAGNRPTAIGEFRFTSHDRDVLEQIADMYGGTVRPWSDPKAAEGQHEVITDAPQIRVILPPDPLGGTPIYELWGGGGCERRCDGVTAQVWQRGPDGPEPADTQCICAARGELACGVKTRLSVILPEVNFAGVWRLDTSSENAAKELPGMVDLIRDQQAKGLQYATLAIKHRRSVQAGQTRRFLVPVLGMGVSIEQLAAGAANVGGLGAGAAAGEIGAGQPAPTVGELSAGATEVAPPGEHPEPSPAPRALDPDDDVVDAEVIDGPTDDLIDRERVITLAKWAEKAWPLADYGRGKTAHRDRLRRALTLRITDGRTTHLDQLTTAEADRLSRGLSLIVEGAVTWAATDEALIITGEGMRAEYPWAEDPS